MSKRLNSPPHVFTLKWIIPFENQLKGLTYGLTWFNAFTSRNKGRVKLIYPTICCCACIWETAQLWRNNVTEKTVHLKCSPLPLASGLTSLSGNIRGLCNGDRQPWKLLFILGNLSVRGSSIYVDFTVIFEFGMFVFNHETSKIVLLLKYFDPLKVGYLNNITVASICKLIYLQENWTVQSNLSTPQVVLK